jgi:hypothetical protein
VSQLPPHIEKKKCFLPSFFFYILVYLWFMTARSAEKKKTPRVSPIFHGLTGWLCVVYYSSSMVYGREKPSGKESTSKESAVA